MIIIGDTHGVRPLFEIVDKKRLTNQNLIHVGDLGLGFQSIYQDLKNLDILDEMLLETNNHLYVIRGNHDCPIFWDKSKGLNLPKYHNLHLMEDYSSATIEGKTLLFVGGAISIDRILRMDDKPYPSWWKDEEFVYDYKKLISTIEKVKSIDIVITHTAPSFCHPIGVDGVKIIEYWHGVEKTHGKSLKKELNAERDMVSLLHKEINDFSEQKPTHWFYGHFHTSKTEVIDETSFNLLGINELKELL